MVRSALSVFCGFLLLALARFPYLFLRRHVLTQDALPQPAWFLTHVLFSVACGALSGYLTAALARRMEFRHVMAVTLLFLSVGGLVLLSERSLPLTWYHAGLFILMVPSILLGALFRQIWKAPRFH